jgi:alcohol dehydrogenase class IV
MHMADVATVTLGFSSPDLRFGDNVIDELSNLLESYGITKALVVTDEGVERAGIVERVVGDLSVPIQIYYATTEPSTNDFEDLPEDDIDGVVAVGGGSCIDTAKMVALLLTYGGHASDYIGVGGIPGEIAPLIAVPTTSGTGSQATQTTVITHDGVKRGVSDERLRPDAALVDPALTFGLPQDATARSGFDAFVHSLESLTARKYEWIPKRPITYQGANPISKSLAEQALHLTHGALERSVFDPADHEARRMMSLGSHLAGTAFSASGLGAVHAIASTVGGLTNRPHGECLAVSIRAGLTYNLPVRRDAYAKVVRDLGITDASTQTVATDALINECERLASDIGLPSSLHEVDLGPEDVEKMVENTLVQERRLKTNPRDIGSDLGEHLEQFLVAE